MKPPHQHLRIDLAEMKGEIFKKLGPEGSKRYFYYLSRFLNLKLSKVEFNKLSLRVVGRENIPLHNQFVHSILKNSCNAKVPPPKEALKSVDKKREPNKSVSSNGDILPLPLQNVPTEFRDRKISSCSSSVIKLENGDLSRISMHHHQVLTKDSAYEGEVSHYWHHANLSKRLQDEAICSKDRRDASDRILFQVPLGASGPRKTMPSASTEFCAASSFSISGLLDSSALRERMEKIALMQGLQGVTMDCASLLNKGLDLYLKGLISSGVNLVGARLGSEQTQSYKNKHQPSLKLVNGVTPGHHHKHKLGDMPLGGIQEKIPSPLSLLDIKVAMELNPQQLGEDWPFLLEKMCTHAFGEE